MELLGLVIMLPYAILGIYLFHQVFTVFYFDLGAGLLKEFICGLIFAGLCVWLWWAADIVLALIAFKAHSVNKPILCKVCIGFIILTTILGILFRA